MRKLFILLLAVFPLLTYSQPERAQLEKDIAKFILATNTMDCESLLYYAPRFVFVDQTEADFLRKCQNKRIEFTGIVQRTLSQDIVMDTLAISNGSQYAKFRIPAEVEMEFATDEEGDEFHDDTFYYQLLESYCDKLIDRSNIGEVVADHDAHKVYYSCTVSVLGLWEDGHWTFVEQKQSEKLPPLNVLDPDLLEQ